MKKSGCVTWINEDIELWAVTDAVLEQMYWAHVSPHKCKFDTLPSGYLLWEEV